MEEFEELPSVLLAIVIAVWLVQQLKRLDEDFQTFSEDVRLHHGVAEEFLQDFYGGVAEVSVAKADEEVVLQT